MSAPPAPADQNPHRHRTSTACIDTDDAAGQAIAKAIAADPCKDLFFASESCMEKNPGDWRKCQAQLKAFRACKQASA